nr:Uncharacterised protein [Raoultella sp. NCTC 9187]
MPLLLDSGPPTVTSGEDLQALNFQHFQLNAAIVKQQDIARHDVRRQPFIVNTDFFLVAFAFAKLGVQQEFIADIEENFCLL